MIGFFATIGSLIVSAIVMLIIGSTYYLAIESDGDARGRMVVMLVVEWVLIASMLYLTLRGVE